MRSIEFDIIAGEVEKMCVEAAHVLPQDVKDALIYAAKKERSKTAAGILDKLIENAEIAEKDKIPLCQDTGLAIVFVKQGVDTVIKNGTGGICLMSDAVNAGVASGYEKGYLRKSVVADPLNGRENTGTNTPAIMYHEIVAGDKIELSVMLKGGGCENKSQFKMFNPTADRNEIIHWIVDVVKQAGANACPPFIVGVGIGGNFEQSCLLSKKALMRKLDSKNNDEYYQKMEADLVREINGLDIGPQGFGGSVTALACLIKTMPCHIASLPVAVNIECHSHRHCSVMI